MVTNTLFECKNKKVLLYLGKFPAYGFDIDGGSILANQLINALKKICILDVVFIRKHDEVFIDNEVRDIRYVKYQNAEENKFIRRLKNLESNRKALERFNEYDVIITAHVSKFFGMQTYGSEFWNKTILFPMFCTKSYQLAGEIVPPEYTHMEYEVLCRVNKIITPSEIEKDDLIRDYQCSEHKIKLIRRGLSPLIKRRPNYEIHNPLRLTYIASIKKQKNHFAIIELLTIFKSLNINLELHLIFTIQEKILYNKFCKQISSVDLDKMIIWHEAISQEELAEILYQSDINISMSLWETFGRGIFEGMAAGLPTFVFDKLQNVRNICGNNQGIYFAKNISDMAEAIFKLIQDKEKYKFLSDEAVKMAANFSYNAERDALVKEILSG